MEEYKQELDWGNPKTVDLFLKLVDKYIEKQIKTLKFDRKLPATIVSVGSGVANIKLLGSGTEIPSVKIRDGLSLSPNDEVYITLINGESNNMFIDVKK